MSSREERIQQLKKYFTRRDDVVMAFLFGSRAEGRSHGESDWDIAVYFKPETGRVEWEDHDRAYPEEQTVWSDCADIVGTDRLDLVVLNRAPATLADAAIHGVPLADKDRGLFLSFMLIITDAAESFRRYIDDYYAIYQRSRSLAPRDKERLERILPFLEEQLLYYDEFRKLTEKVYARDFMKRGAVERWVENIMNAAIDISKIILASERRMVPQAYRESMKQAIWSLKLPEEYIQKLDRWVKIRNEFAHEYLDIKWKNISGFIADSEPYMKEFLAAVKRFLEAARKSDFS